MINIWPEYLEMLPYNQQYVRQDVNIPTRCPAVDVLQSLLTTLSPCHAAVPSNLARHTKESGHPTSKQYRILTSLPLYFWRFICLCTLLSVSSCGAWPIIVLCYSRAARVWCRVSQDWRGGTSGLGGTGRRQGGGGLQPVQRGGAGRAYLAGAGLPSGVHSWPGVRQDPRAGLPVSPSNQRETSRVFLVSSCFQPIKKQWM